MSTQRTLLSQCCYGTMFRLPNSYIPGCTTRRSRDILKFCLSIYDLFLWLEVGTQSLFPDGSTLEEVSADLIHNWKVREKPGSCINVAKYILFCNDCSDAKWTRFLFILELGQHFYTRSTSLKQAVPFEIGKVENILQYNNFYIHTVDQLPRSPPDSAHCSSASDVFAPLVRMKNTTSTRCNWWQLSGVWVHGVPAPVDRKHHKRWRCKGSD